MKLWQLSSVNKKIVKLHELLACFVDVRSLLDMTENNDIDFFLEERNSSLVNEHLLSYWKQLSCFISIFACKVLFIKRVVCEC